MNNTQLKAARTIVKHLAADLQMAKDRLPAEYHDDREALITMLAKALTTAQNVLRGIERSS